MVLDPGSQFMSPDLDGGHKSQSTTNKKSKHYFRGLRQSLEKRYHGGYGSENAPDESGFLSDEEGALMEVRHRIVNESSLRKEEDAEDYYYGEELQDEDFEASGGPLISGEGYLTVSQKLMLTGKSESAINDDDDESYCPSHSGRSLNRAINSSCVNLKRANFSECI